MSETREQTAETIRCILKFLTSNGVYAWRQNVTGIPLPSGGFRPGGKRGVSDILAILPSGRFMAVEVKTGKDRISPEQEGFQTNIRNNNGLVFIVSSCEDFIQQFGQDKLKFVGVRL